MRKLRWLIAAILALLVAGLVAPTVAQAATTSTFTMAAASDDAEQRSSATDLGSSDLEMNQDGSVHQIVGLRYPNVAIPKGATITSARIQFSADASPGTGSPVITVKGQAQDNAATYTTGGTDISSRPVTIASVAWSPAAWTGGARGAAQQTPDLKALVQEIVNRSGWASGNGMGFTLTNPSTSALRRAVAWNASAANGAALVVTWDAPLKINVRPLAGAPGANGDMTMANITAGQSVNFNGNWTVENADAPTGVRVTWYVDGVFFSHIAYFPAPVGSYGSLSPDAWTATAGTHTLKMVMDAANELDESNEADNEASRTFTVAAAPTNTAPTVSAGADQAVTLPASANLDGTVSDDGLPSGSSVSSTWSKVSGPGTVTFGNASAVDTTASFSAAGSYVLRLTASDSALSSSDDVAVTVSPAPPANQAPSVSAGPDRAVTLPASASLDGTVSDDGLPSGSSVTQTWSKVSGPGTVTFGSASAVDTTASFSVAGSYVLRLTASDGALSSSDDMAATVSAAPVAPTFPTCPSTVVRPFASGTTLTTQYKVASPGSSTYEFDGVTSTAYPNGSASPFAFGNTTPPADFCMNDGALAGTTDDSLGWSYYHNNANAACVRIVATHTVQVNRTDCHDVEDGLKFLENENSVGNDNTTTFYSSGVHLDRVRDDCMENDFTLGGVLYDSLWERCNTGLSERPASANGTWTSPAGETVTMDHMLVGLWDTWHEADAKNGANGLFKWSTSANHLVIKCSTFKVESLSLNGADAMDIPAGTVVDDSACPNDPTTIVWLGGGTYPGNLNGTGIQISTNVADWNNKVSAWKAAH